jgi:putative ABC transport system permease protein
MPVLFHKLRRDLWQSKGQVTAVLAVMVCGIAIFTAFFACYRNLLLTRDSYYARYRFHDFSLQLEKAPLSAVFKLAALPGVRAARGRIVKDVSLSVSGQNEAKVARLISFPLRHAGMIDDIHLVSGRHFSAAAPDECLVNDRFLNANGLRAGDRLQVTVNGRRQSLKIVGAAQSPEYIYTIRNAQEMLPNPRKFAVIWVQEAWAESHLDLKGAVNEIVAEAFEPARLRRLLDQAEDLLKPYGVYARVERRNQLSNWYLQSELEGLKVSTGVTPAVFLLIAALILVILLSRMVRREQMQIGLLKAYGYTDLEIALHYVRFALIIGLVGGLVGYGCGEWMGRGLIGIYVAYYTFPVLTYQFYPDLLLWGLLISTGCALFSALAVIRSVVQIEPALAMRDSPQRSARRTWLERLPFIWRRLSFTHKIIARNISRFPLRSAFTVLGVTLSTAIVILGYFASDAMGYMIHHQFDLVQREDIRVTFYRERGRAALYEIQRLPGVRRAEPQLLYPFELRRGWQRKEMLITGLSEPSRLFRLLDAEQRRVESGRTGLTLLDIEARRLNLRVGDQVWLKPMYGRIATEKPVIVDKIVAQFIGAGGYMRRERLSRLLGEADTLNAVLLQTEPGMAQAVAARLKDLPVVASVEIKADALRNFNQTIGESMGISNFFLTLFAGVIAVAVIYNSTAINITERSREMASLRVLGYTTEEVGRIVFNESLLLSLLGLGLGLPVGTGLCRLMTEAYVTDVYRFPYYLSMQTYWVSALTILGYVLLSNALSRRRIAHLDLVEALKSRE